MGNVNCLRCRFRHEDNGNCTAVGGFCTAVTAAHCPLLREYLDTGLEPEEINDLASVREISPETEYAINKHADNIIERLDKLLHQTDDDIRLRELADADKDGRVVVRPYRLGAEVYVLLEDCTTFYPETNGWYVGKETIGAITPDGFYLGDPVDDCFTPDSEVGKSVFLTYDEADEALEGMKK